MTNLELYSWILRGTQRMAIVKVMDKPKIPRDIRKEAKEFSDKISKDNTSTVLRSFVKKGIAICLNEEQKTGRLYKLTRAGKAIRGEIIKGEKHLPLT